MPMLPFRDIGPCEVHWGYGYQSGYMPLVMTPYLGRVIIRIADMVTDIHEEGKGIAPIDSFFEGTTVELEVPMTRSTLIQLAQTIGWQKMGRLTGPVLKLDNIAGFDMYPYTETVVIKPLCNNVPDPDPHNWIELHKCHPYREIELGFDRSGQRIHLVKFKVFPSRDSGYAGAGGGGQYLQEGMQAWRTDFDDDFCGVTLGPEWITDSLDANRTITINASPTCTVTIAAANAVDARWWCSTNEAPKMYMPLGCIGPCKITTLLSSITAEPPGVAPNNTMAGMFIGTNPLGTDPGSPPFTAYLWGRYQAPGGSDMRVQDNCGSFGAMEDCSSGCLPKYLKIEIDVSQVITFWWKDLVGDVWTQYVPDATGIAVTIPNGGHPAYDIANCYVGLFAKNINGAANLAATFEFFEIKSYA